MITAFMSNINQRGDRDIEKYVDLGYKLLDVNIRQIVFIERRVFERYFRLRYQGFPRIFGREVSYENTECCVDASVPKILTFPYEYIVLGHITFVFFEKTDMYFHAHRDTITEFSVNTPHPTKDTLDYMFVQCHKTEWVSLAIRLDEVAYENKSFTYAWVDFGIRHMFPSDIACDMELYQLRDRITRSGASYSKVFAPSCWNPNCVYYQDVYRNIMWVFAGSVFGGNADVLCEFARRTKEKCLGIIREKRHLMWEVNVWYMVFQDCRELFALYHGDHNASILRECCLP